jgi:hypothetical protein
VKEETMSKDITKVKRVISTALNAAFSRALEQEQAEGETVLDIRDGRFVIFSDHHKGSRDGADDFKVCERAYNAALAYYDRLGYTLAVLGDAEELWEENETVLKASHRWNWKANSTKTGATSAFGATMMTPGVTATWSINGSSLHLEEGISRCARA